MLPKHVTGVFVRRALSVLTLRQGCLEARYEMLLTDSQPILTWPLQSITVCHSKFKV